MSDTTIRESIDIFLRYLASEKSRNTVNTYRGALGKFANFLQDQGIGVDTVSVSQISESWMTDFFRSIQKLASSTKEIYFYALISWHEFLVSQGMAQINIEELRQTILPSLGKHVRRPVSQPDPYDVAQIINHVMNLADIPNSDKYKRLRLLRDRALIVTLADTNIEVSALSEMRMKHIDWRKSRFLLPGESRENAFIKFTPRVSKLLRDYLDTRASLDKAARRSQSALPVFAAHRSSDGNKVLPISPYSGIRGIIRRRAREALGVQYDGSITPISFRHSHLTSLLLSLASFHPKIIEKCQTHFENGKYDDAIFNAMKVIEEEVRNRIAADATDLGVRLIIKAMQVEPPLISFSTVKAEQEAASFLFRGAIGSFKNPHSHRFVGVTAPTTTFECLALASLLMRMLENAS